MSGLRAAINAKCKDCIYDDLMEGTWLKQVELCTSSDCPLYPHRPIPKKSKPRIVHDLRARNEKGEWI